MATTGQILWRTEYGAVPPEARTLKLVGAPNQVALSPDGKRLYLTSNWEPQPSPGVWVFDAMTGAVQDQVLPEVGTTGIAVDADGNLFVATPAAGGQLWILPGGDPQRGQLLRNDLGDRVSGVVVAN